MKYFSPATDYSALQRELTDQESRAAARRPEPLEPVEPDYSAYADKYADDDDGGEESGSRRTG